ncbi:hypothetical protein RRG08_000952 [Elysia crispata]|uniref:Uncharacterized protein n=1 Tax=Elysia crispata TaxID=231223 RepID=A0AAE1AGN9_9GAST|nr:hypothetical protein RRG08_000952 [Elysia crispata]
MFTRSARRFVPYTISSVPATGSTRLPAHGRSERHVTVRWTLGGVLFLVYHVSSPPDRSHYWPASLSDSPGPIRPTLGRASPWVSK